MREAEKEFWTKIVVDGTLTLAFILITHAFTGPFGVILYSSYFLWRLQTRLDMLLVKMERS